MLDVVKEGILLLRKNGISLAGIQKKYPYSKHYIGRTCCKSGVYLKSYSMGESEEAQVIFKRVQVPEIVVVEAKARQAKARQRKKAAAKLKIHRKPRRPKKAA